MIVGLGLLGGSYAKGLKRYGFRRTAITKEQSSIDYAVEKGIIDEGSTSPDERLKKTLENDDCEEMRKIMQASTKRRKKFDKEL